MIISLLNQVDHEIISCRTITPFSWRKDEFVPCPRDIIMPKLIYKREKMFKK